MAPGRACLSLVEGLALQLRQPVFAGHEVGGELVGAGGEALDERLGRQRSPRRRIRARRRVVVQVCGGVRVEHHLANELVNTVVAGFSGTGG
jgi:hypothetical protein